MMLPPNHFGEVWSHKESTEIWAWQLTLLEEDKNTRIASGVAGTYLEAMQSLSSVASLWLTAGYTVGDVRSRNLRERFAEEEPRRPIGFPTVR